MFLEGLRKYEFGLEKKNSATVKTKKERSVYWAQNVPQLSHL